MDGDNLVIVDTTVRLLTLADTPEFQELMAAIDELIDNQYVVELSTRRLEDAKEKLLAKVVK